MTAVMTEIKVPIKLNLGGAGEGKASYRVPGFLTVDLRNEGDTDVVSDVSDLSMFKDSSVEEIYSSNVLEHFPHVDTVKVLKEWCRVLKPQGKLWLSVPDLMASMRLLQREGQTEWVTYLLYGDQLHPLNFHYINFSFGYLAQKVVEAGFSDIKRLEKLPYGVQDASEHRDNHLGQRISLNVEVTR